MVLVNVFVLGLELFSDVGIGPAVIQNERDDESFVNTVWTIQIFRGAALFLVACITAPFTRSLWVARHCHIGSRGRSCCVG